LGTACGKLFRVGCLSITDAVSWIIYSIGSVWLLRAS
jgi:ribosomal protein L30E